MKYENTEALKTAIDRLTGTGDLFKPLAAPITNPKVIQGLQSKTEVASAISVKVRVAYTSLSDNAKDRDVILRRVIKGRSGTFLDVLVIELNEPRLIKLQNISSIYDYESGKTFSDPVMFLDNVLGVSVQSKPDDAAKPKPKSMLDGELKSAIALSRHELTALVFVCAIDGDRDEREYKEIANYLHARTPHLSFRDLDLYAYLDKLYPDEGSFFQALEAILGKESWVIGLFLETMIHLIRSDGKVDPKEKEFLGTIFTVLGLEGYKVQYKLKS